MTRRCGCCTSGVLAVAAALLPGFLVLVQHWPYALWPLQGTAVGLLAAGAVWCFDEPLAAIVDTTPRNLLWRTAARSVGVVLLVCAWSAAVAWTRSGLFGHALDVAWQGVAAVVAVGAFATWRRAAGVATPARPIAAGLVSVCVFLALARPFEDRLPIFPYTAHGDWAGGRMIWTVAALAGLLLLTRVHAHPEPAGEPPKTRVKSRF